ncbi:MAG: 5-(carboxyamino)imidazole ribonucleotide synthase [Leptospira sp.]|nr:5-(carboxyamino)imidazole ribonucleotide synthase [Leptospira sp.]
MLLPGNTLGVMGSGQLGRMFSQSAIRHGYKVHVYSPDTATPSGKAGASESVGSYENTKKLRKFLNEIDGLTFEFENIPEIALSTIEDFAKKNSIPISPSPHAIRIAQERSVEKTFFRKIGLKTAEFFLIRSLKDFEANKGWIQYPCIVKENKFGYDGKGQYRIKRESDLIRLLKSKKKIDFIIEEIIPFEKEISVIGARFLNGSTAMFKPSENIHTNHILDFSIYPARIEKEIITKAMKSTEILMDGLNYVGVLGFEFFIKKGELICNEFAPRPHNSGHFSMDAANLSQFDLQLRTLCNIPIDKSLESVPCIMKNIMGEHFLKDMNSSAKRLADPDFRLHLYQKDIPKKGRKMGHWNYIVKENSGNLPEAFEN